MYPIKLGFNEGFEGFYLDTKEEYNATLTV
jgi:hypothetical protein